jgi:acetate kinase
LHQPHNLAAIRAMAAIVPNLPQVACFDTAFHYGRPEVATRLALPRAFHDRGIRRYGFHGLSYEYVARRLREIDPDLASGRVIVAHLGNGASLCAMANGRSIDTSMGFTALDGLMMGTRCGTIDPGVLLHLQMQEGMSAAEVEQMLYNRSGLLGVSGVSSDMRTLHLSDDPAAAEALDLFVWRAVREIGALIAVLGGIDGLIFTAGIGENDPLIRAAICDRLDWAGAQVEASANAANAGSVAAADSRVAIRVIATDEERMIALHTLETLGDRSRAALTPR